MAVGAHSRVAAREPNHMLRIFLIWLVLSVIATPLAYFVLGPIMPPGTMSNTADGQSFDNRVLVTLAAPVMIAVWVFFGYSLVVFRARGTEMVDGAPPVKQGARIQFAWVVVTTAIVLGLFAFGTYELLAPYGAGSGNGPAPIRNPPGKYLQVQVIGQQWRWTYRWPQYGGVETTGIELPVGTYVQVHVTSLDVIHSWWAYELGVKADANPGVDNISYVKPLHTGPFTARCAELCGIWHGAMYTFGRVVTPAQFENWISAQVAKYAAVTPKLPPFAYTYNPTACGADGGFYPPSYPLSPCAR